MKYTNLKFEDLVKGQFYKVTSVNSWAYIFQYDGSSLKGSGTNYISLDTNKGIYVLVLHTLSSPGANLNTDSNRNLLTYLEATDEEIKVLLSRLPKEEVLPYVKKILYEAY